MYASPDLQTEEENQRHFGVCACPVVTKDGVVCTSARGRARGITRPRPARATALA